MYALAEISGFQYKLEKGGKLKVPKVDVEIGGKVKIDRIMLVSDGDNVAVGAPFVDGAFAEATVTAHDKYDKVVIFKKRRRKDYSVKKGHRQDFTEIQIDNIETK